MKKIYALLGIALGLMSCKDMTVSNETGAKAERSLVRGEGLFRVILRNDTVITLHDIEFATLYNGVYTFATRNRSSLIKNIELLELHGIYGINIDYSYNGGYHLFNISKKEIASVLDDYSDEVLS